MLNTCWTETLPIILQDEYFVDWCIEHGKKAIDAGADLIVLDEIQGSSFIPMYQWASQYIDWLSAPGFSNITIQKFREFLANKYSNEAANSYSLGTPRGSGYWSKAMRASYSFHRLENKFYIFNLLLHSISLILHAYLNSISCCVNQFLSILLFLLY